MIISLKKKQFVGWRPWQNPPVAVRSGDPRAWWSTYWWIDRRFPRPHRSFSLGKVWTGWMGIYHSSIWKMIFDLPLDVFIFSCFNLSSCHPTIDVIFGGWLRNPAPPKGWLKHQKDSMGWFPSINWCRISQPSTISGGFHFQWVPVRFPMILPASEGWSTVRNCNVWWMKQQESRVEWMMEMWIYRHPDNFAELAFSCLCANWFQCPTLGDTSGHLVGEP